MFIQSSRLILINKVTGMLCHAMSQLMSDHVKILCEICEDSAITVSISHFRTIPEGVHILHTEMDIVNLVHTKVINGVPAQFIFVVITYRAPMIISSIHSIICSKRIPLASHQSIGRRLTPLRGTGIYLPACGPFGWCHDSFDDVFRLWRIGSLTGSVGAYLIVLS